MSLLWVFVEDLNERAGPQALSADEARHVVARRLREGDALVLFDGAGHCANARITSLRRRAVEVDWDTSDYTPPAAASGVIASAIPKADRLSTMLQMLTQLGVTRWQPLVLADSVVRELDPESARLRRIRVESAKLARRPWLLSVAAPRTLEELLQERTDGAEEVAAIPAPTEIFYGDREGTAALDTQDALVVIGPEAGLRPQERQRLEEVGARACSFSPHNMRIETAAIAAAVALHLAHRTGAQHVSG